MRGEGLNRAAAPATLQVMASARLVRLLVVLALPAVWGAAGARTLVPGAPNHVAACPAITPGAAPASTPRTAAHPSGEVVAPQTCQPVGPVALSAPAAQALAASLTDSDAPARASLVPLGTLASLSAPRQSLPPPVHDEATCAFCQAAIFAPCAPQPVAVSLQLGLVRHERVPTDAVQPQFSTHRRTSSRAPPTLRSI